MQRFIKWIKKWFVILPSEPDIVKPKDRDGMGLPKFGFRWWF